MLGWPWSEQLQAAVCTVSSNPSIPPGGRGVGGGGRDGGAGWGVEKWMRCTVGASQKAVGGERALLSSSAMREKRENDAGRMCVEVGSVSVSINRERY